MKSARGAMIEGTDKRATRTEERERVEGESMLGAIDETAKKKKLTGYLQYFPIRGILLP